MRFSAPRTVWTTGTASRKPPSSTPLGPIASLAHSGEEFARRADSVNIGSVFAAIDERAAHLHQFISGYATFAKLPAPRPERIDWREFTDELVRTHPFEFAAPLTERLGWFDRSQIEHALINLMKMRTRREVVMMRSNCSSHMRTPSNASKCAIADQE